MKTSYRARDDFRDLARQLVDCSEGHQIALLKGELLEVLERADGFERDLELLEDAAVLGDAFDPLSLPRSLLDLEKRILAAAGPEAADPAGQRRALKALRLELFEMERQCQALDALCRLLLRRTDAPQPSAPTAASESTRFEALL